MTDSLFAAADTFLLRTPVLSKGKALDPPPTGVRPAATGTDAPDPAPESVNDALLREAIALSSPSLAQRLRSIARGNPTSPRTQSKALASAARYRIRMATRSTPYGLMAGVAIGQFSEDTSAVLGPAHRKRVKPDNGWLRGELKERLRSRALDRHDLRLVVNNTCSLRAGRLLAPVTVRDGKAVRSSVRCSPAVEALLQLAAEPVPASELHDVLLEKFPQAGSRKLWGFLKSLVDLEILLTDAVPPPWHDAPLAHVLDRDPDWDDGHRWARLAAAYQDRPVGRGHEELRALQEASGSASGIQVDLAVDAEVRLPPAVAREAERAATLLWRLSSGDTPGRRSLRAYHAEFLERHSVGERVPVTRLLDPDAGLGAPAGYTLPGSHRTVLPAPEPDAARERILHRLFAEALTAGHRHVELDEKDIEALSYRHAEPPSSMDLITSVVAGSTEAMARGDFHLVLSPMTGTRQAGAIWGRFAHLLDTTETLTELTRSAHLTLGQALPVQLFHATPAERHANVTGIPKVTDVHLSVGLYETPDATDTVRLSDVTVSADWDTFHLWDEASGREIAPFSAHVLSPSETPDIARFLWEAPTLATRPAVPWDWGTLKASPFLPGVRHGRTLLWPASWRVQAGAFADPPADEEEALQQWRSRWNVPDRVRLAQADMFVALDLRLPGHRTLLAEEARKSDCLLYEDPTLERRSWLTGPDGPHEAEIVIPLFTTPPTGSPDRAQRSAPAPRRTADLRHPPGGDWISLHLYGSTEAQPDLLRTAVRPWLANLAEQVDRWFFIRYADEATGRPHLRLRLHGEPHILNSEVLPHLGSWTRDLLADGVINDVALRTYAPEAERYGGNAFLAETECFFQADSLMVLDRLGAPSDALTVAADLTALVRHFLRDSDEDPAEWLLQAYLKDPVLHRAYASRRREARALMSTPSAADDSTSAARDDWAERLARLGAGLRKAAASEPWLSPTNVLRALLHMHCNRRLAPTLESERTIYAYVRGMAEDTVSLRRHVP
ncbi:lantibiotic dehydratase [Streptomyces sp. NPDC005483]|uniref:lantibiotic dehydratase n=1 Tax=Streptomyces sp. NPDC005483 TaxID=3154882 RepID=UPI0033AE25B2